MNKVTVHIVTLNSEKSIRSCVDSVLAQSGPGFMEMQLEIVVTDNASTDGTLEALAGYGDRISITSNEHNLGFCRAHNDGITRALAGRADFVFVLNPDVRLEPDSIAELLASLSGDTRAGSATPKLLRADADLQPVEPRRIDAAGMYMTLALRHFDRGSEQADTAQFEREEYVFGGTGAALLLKRSFIEDVALAHSPEQIELFDNRFFAYREDADLAWRGLIAGWRCRYVPRAVAFHERRVLPERRSALPPELNAMSVRNRFLLQRNNFRFDANWRSLPLTLARNLLVLGGVLLKEQSSLRSLFEAFKLTGKRRIIQAKRREAPHEIARWFQNEPYTEPALRQKAAVLNGAAKIPFIEAVVVNFNSGARVRHCVDSLLSAADQLPFALAITVVDNASADGSAEQLAALKDIRLIRSEKNLGFAGAINHALERSRAGAYLVLNPDVTIGAVAIEQLQSALGHFERLGVVAPTLTDSSGAPQIGFTVRRLPTVTSTLIELFGLHKLWPGNPWTRALRMEGDLLLSDYLNGRSRPEPGLRTDRPVRVEQPAGACLLIRRAAFEDLGGFAAEFWPAWFEDVDFCKRAGGRDWSIAVCGSARATHEGGYSVQTIPRHRFAQYWYSNLIRYWRKHGTPAQYGVLRCGLALALVGRSFLSFVSSYRRALPERSDDQRLAAELFRLAFNGS